MEAITELKTPVTELTDLDFDTESLDLPQSGDFVACGQCGHRSYMHYFFMDGLLSYCKNHGERNAEKLGELGAPLVADFRSELYEENRLVED